MEKISFLSRQKDWKKFELNNKSIALNILYVPHNTEETAYAYVSKCNTNREDQVILLMINDGKKCHYLEGKKISPLLRGVTLKYVGSFYCLNCLHSYRTEKSLKSITMYVKTTIIVRYKYLMKTIEYEHTTMEKSL